MQVRIKDFESARLKTLVIPTLARQAMEVTDYSAHTMLMRRNWDDPIGGLNKLYIGRPMGFDPNMEQQRSAQKKQSGNKYGGPGAPPEDQTATQIKLEEKKEACGPRQDLEKYTFNVTDNRGIPEEMALGDGGNPWLTEHKRLEQRGGLVGTKHGQFVKKVLPTPETLEEHGTKPKQKTLDAEWEGIREHNRQ